MRNDQIKVILIACCAILGVIAGAIVVSIIEANGIEMDGQWTMTTIFIGLLVGVVVGARLAL